MKQRTILQFEKSCLVTRIHVDDMRVGRFNVYIAEELENPKSWIKVCTDLEVVHGKERIIKPGCLPALYVIIEMTKGVPLLDLKKVRVYGMERS